MADAEQEEVQQEFEWLLKEEVPAVLKQLQDIIIECCRRFPIQEKGIETLVKSEKFVMANTSHTATDQIKCIVSLNGDNITYADINLKIHKHTNQVHRTIVQNECPWKLQQIQDASNHLYQASQLLIQVQNDYQFGSPDEVIHFLTKLMSCLQRGRTSLVLPRKRTIDDLLNSKNMKSLQPPLPSDLAISFYIQSHKLVFAMYHLQHHHGVSKFDTLQAECSVPWLNESLVLFTMAMQLAQQLKDKVSVFSQYRDLIFE
uniref:Protein rogdi n=1 Tax=Strigamia maritima TaxID=126957 RepID=T1JJT6_STRMM